jgi:hypothetical protein
VGIYAASITSVIKQVFGDDAIRKVAVETVRNRGVQ